MAEPSPSPGPAIESGAGTDRLTVPGTGGLRLCVALALLMLGLLVVPGLRWGLPSRVRNRLSLGKDLERWRAPVGIAEEIEEPWTAYPNYLRGGWPRTGSQPRSAFNPVRSYHPDEYVILKSLSGMRPERLKMFPGFFGWPAFHFYVVGAALKLASLLGVVRLVPSLDFYFRNPGEMARLYLVGRVVTLLFAAGCVVVFARSAARLWGWEAGAATALLLALTPLFTMNAHYMTADVPMLFWIGLVFLASVHIYRGGGRRWYVLGGACLGIAAATRYQGALAALLLLWAHLLARPMRGPAGPEERGALGRLASVNLWLAAVVSVLVFLALNPYILARPGQFWAEVRGELGGARNPLPPPVAAGLFLESGFGMMFSGTALAALLMAAARRERAVHFVLLGFGVPVVVLCLARPAMVRYLMPVAPLPALLVAWAFFRIHRRGVEIGKRRTVAAAPVLLAVLLLATGAQSFQMARLFTDPQADTRTRAGEWIAENLPQGATIGVVSEPWQFELPPLDRSRFRVIVVKPEPEALARARPDYFVSSDFQFPPLAIRGPLSAKEKAFWREVFQGGGRYVIARRFEAWPAGRKVFLQSGPHDMRYPNPVIVVAWRAERAPAGGSRRSGSEDAP